MKILQIKVMRGPNYWSVEQHKLIVLKVSAGTSVALFSQQKGQLSTGIKGSSPLLISNVANSRSIYELVGKIALELQCLADMPNTYLDTPHSEDTKSGCIIFSYSVESAGIYAAKAAVSIINAMVRGADINIEADVSQLNRISRRESLGPTTQAMVDAALLKDIPFTRLDNTSLVMLGHGCNQRMIRAAVASSTSAIAVELAQDKNTTKNILQKGRIPVPEGAVVRNIEDLHSAINQFGFPLVVKPLDGNHGRGITTNIRFIEEAIKAFKLAQKVSAAVIVERYITGADYRFLVINFKLVAVAKRTPACITGDGVSTIQQLIDETNKDPRRGVGHEKVLTAITIDTGTLAILTDAGLKPGSVLPAGKLLLLKDTANLSSGGTADDVTDDVHPHNRFMAERIARLMDLDICGIDIITDDVTVPISNSNGAVLEVNAGPGLRMHLAPSSGMPRNVAAPIVDMLYPDNRPGRIPLVAITGTNGKTTTVRLVAHLARKAGYNTGFTTTDGIYINNQLIEYGDCSGPQSAAVVLRDPLVNFAVLECARGGILRSGLGFDKCDVSILTNISADHLGLEGIDTIEQLAKVKSVVPKSTSANGYSILNADDDLVYQLKNSLQCNIALFSIDYYNPRIQSHINEGKLAALLEDGHFVVYKEKQRHIIANVNDVPLTFNGTAKSMIKNILPAILTAVIYDMLVEAIKDALIEFIPSAENIPGRMNLFEFPNCKLMLDYAHNEGGYRELKAYADKVEASAKIGVIAATGDRREQDIIKLGELAAEIFDKIIIRHDKNGRGRSNEELTNLLLKGIERAKPNMPLNIISDEKEAIKYAVTHADKDAWVFANCDDVKETVAFMADLHNELVEA
jgi:cyanophycin synthetase